MGLTYTVDEPEIEPLVSHSVSSLKRSTGKPVCCKDGEEPR